MVRIERNSAAWKKYFENHGIRQELTALYMRYVSWMLENDLPIIFEFLHLAALLGRTPEYLASAINATQNHYREFTIPKRRGGVRTIDAPYPALLECQQWINNKILSKVPIHNAAHGFKKGKSILTNATQHCAKRNLLKMDIKDFFPSIGIEKVIKVFQSTGYPKNVALYLAKLCCLNGRLPQGAATSPALSNIVAMRLDARLTGMARMLKLTYSRYADDLVFSGNKIHPWAIDALNRVVVQEGFTLNTEKTQLIRTDRRRIVTGLSVAGNTPHVPARYKRALRQEIHYILKYGYNSHASKRKIRNPFYIDSLCGRLNFWKSIEPQNQFIIENLPKIEAIRKASHLTS